MLCTQQVFQQDCFIYANKKISLKCIDCVAAIADLHPQRSSSVILQRPALEAHPHVGGVKRLSTTSNEIV